MPISAFCTEFWCEPFCNIVTMLLSVFLEFGPFVPVRFVPVLRFVPVHFVPVRLCRFGLCPFASCWFGSCSSSSFHGHLVRGPGEYPWEAILPWGAHVPKALAFTLSEVLRMCLIVKQCRRSHAPGLHWQRKNAANECICYCSRTLVTLPTPKAADSLPGTLPWPHQKLHRCSTTLNSWDKKTREGQSKRGALNWTR